MAEYSRFFGSEGAVEYSQPQFAEVLSKIFTNGVFADVANELAVTEHDPVALAVDVDTGEAWINGYWYQDTASLVKTLAAADPDLDRIDLIILRLDTTENLKISCEVLTGTPAGSPEAPELTQTDATYEIALAEVLVEAGVTSVSNAKITDVREYAMAPNADKLDGYDASDFATITTTIASSATPTPVRASKYTLYEITALAEDPTFGEPTGTPQKGDRLLFWITDDGTGRTISRNAVYENGTAEMASGTTASTKLTELYIYNGTKWQCVYSAEDVS